MDEEAGDDSRTFLHSPDLAGSVGDLPGTQLVPLPFDEMLLLLLCWLRFDFQSFIFGRNRCTLLRNDPNYAKAAAGIGRARLRLTVDSAKVKCTCDSLLSRVAPLIYFNDNNNDAKAQFRSQKCETSSLASPFPSSPQSYL